MTTYVFEYRDEDGDDLIARPMRGVSAVLILTGTNGIAVDLDRVEEVVAGIRDAARQATAQPADDDEQPTEDRQDHPAAELYVLLRKAGEDRETAQQLIYAHAAMAVRQHQALYGAEASAAGRQDTQTTTDEAPLTAADRQFLTFALDLADERMANRSDEFEDDDHAALARLRRLAAGAES